MTKGPAFDFLGLYSAILEDVQSYLPNDSREWSRDLKSLSVLNKTRGIGFFTLDLPALDRALLRGLETGRLDVRGLVASRQRSRTDLRPRLFWGLWSRLFYEDCSLRANIDPNIVFFLRTLLSTCKTLKVDADPKYLYQVTKELHDVDASLPKPSRFWDYGPHRDPNGNHVFDNHGLREEYGADLFRSEDPYFGRVLDSVQLCADRTSGLLGFFDPDSVRFRHGPGAVSDISSGEFKYEFPFWSDRLAEVFPWDEWGTTSIGLMDRLHTEGIQVDSSEPASRLIAVPKTRKGPRLIASEPSANQWIQQGIRDFLYRRVADTDLGLSIDFFSQKPSQDAVIKASISREHATIDLSSASDRVSCWLVERMFRRNPVLLEAFYACRTRFLTESIDQSLPDILYLRKFSTMGSALTFPVQSLVFLNICLGVGRVLHPRWSWKRLHRQVRIFGDDIIIPVEWEPLVCRVLTSLHLKVNQAKSFKEGFFRESCGMDAYQGHDVTPARIGLSDHEPYARLLASRVTISNNFFQKGLWRAATWLAQTANAPDEVRVVNVESGVFGFKTFCKRSHPTTRKSRWNAALQQLEILCLGPSARQRRLKPNSPARLLQYCTEKPSTHVKWESGVATGMSVSLRRTWVPLGSLGYLPSWA